MIISFTDVLLDVNFANFSTFQCLARPVNTLADERYHLPNNSADSVEQQELSCFSPLLIATSIMCSTYNALYTQCMMYPAVVQILLD